MKYNRFYEARNEIERFLRMDLVGPVEKEEEIEREVPSSYYVAGILHPRDNERAIEEQASPLPSTVTDESQFKDNKDDDSFDGYEESVSQSNSYNPSSMAVSTTIKPNVSHLRIFVTYGKYILVQDSGDDNIDNTEIFEDNDQNGKSLNTKKKYMPDVWKRNHYEKILEVELNGPVVYPVEDHLEFNIFTQKKI